MKSIKAHNINQLMGAPIIALVEAESQSASATAKFISDIGFHNSDNKNNNFGDLKMITFYYEKLNHSGKMQRFKMEVPLLSLVQIPVLKIKDAKINYGIKIIATDKPQKLKENDECNEFLSSITKEKLNVLGLICQNCSNDKNISKDANLQITMNLEQGDLPLGILNLLNSMNDMIQIVPV